MVWIAFGVTFYFMIYLLLRFCLSFAFEPNGGQNLNRGNVIYDEIDWHDYDYLVQEAYRTGLGEQGLPAYSPDSENEEVAKQIAIYGYNGHLSDQIALNRTVLDIRPEKCRVMNYAATLPAVSIIIVFNNEHLKSLLRTCVSIFNRSPPKLMNEIILVDDASDFEDLREPLDEFVENNESKMKLIRLKNRTGLIRARLIAARRAKSEVLIFLDAHCEVNTNWLPPLLGKT